MSNLTTAEHLASERPVDPERVLLLNTIPLTREGFKRKPDFVVQQSALLTNWEEYDTYLVQPILLLLREISQCSRVCIDYDVSFSRFRKAVESEGSDIIFLIAHHLEQENKIEFTRSPTPVTKLIDLLQQPLSSGPKDLLLFSCRSKSFTIIPISPGTRIRSISTADWQMDVLGSYCFIKYWISFLDGNNTLSQAYHAAIGAFLSSVRNQQT